MPHDFDSDRQDGFRPKADRTFKIMGQTLTFKVSVGADPFGRYMDSLDKPYEVFLAAADELVLAWLEPGQEKAWAEVRRPDVEAPLSARELIAFIDRVLEVTTARPTERPSDSSSTSPTGGTS